MPIEVSVVVPAYNAADTLADALQSLVVQTHVDWEAIVVDDGSTDGTAEIAAGFRERDPRFRTLRQVRSGAGAARNLGVGVARFDWLLFLDADDWLAPEALEKTTAALASSTDLDAAYGGWVRVAPNGERIDEPWPGPAVLFPTLARSGAFPIHSCVVRRGLVQEVGGFDPELRTCEDWDLWQRLARAGARFHMVPEPLAYYRMRPGSRTTNAPRHLADALLVIDRGHSRDPRVPRPHPARAEGMPVGGRSDARLSFTGWAAGLMIGGGDDARSLLDAVRDDECPSLDPEAVARSLYLATLLGACRPAAGWVELWPRCRGRVADFLVALEQQSRASGLARRAQRTLELLILEQSGCPLPLENGMSLQVLVDIAQGLPDIAAPEGVDRLQCLVRVEGHPLGVVELPVCDGRVPAPVLADAIAACYAWPILGRFFEGSIYGTSIIRQDAQGVWRGPLRLAEAGDVSRSLHDRIGWTVFLQELWGRPDWPLARFYDPAAAAGEEAPGQRPAEGWLTVEATADLPFIEARGHEVHVELTVGGSGVGIVSFGSPKRRIGPQQLRAAINGATGLELCRVAVREGLLGRPWTGRGTLRQRLAAASASSPERGAPPPTGIVTAPGWHRALGRALPPQTRALVMARHAPGAIGTSASRRASLPGSTADVLREAAAATGEPVVDLRGDGLPPERILYAPDLLWRRSVPESGRQSIPATRRAVQGATYDRHHFEAVFAGRADPWDYAAPYEQLKYEQTLQLLPPGRIGQALELACAEGRFTEQLAPRVGELLATDISEVALVRAAARCAGLPNVRFQQLDLRRDTLLQELDLIVCSEVLYFLPGAKALAAVGRRLADALVPGGHLLSAHTHVLVDDPDEPGLDWDVPFGAKRIGEVLAMAPSLRFVKELRTDLYRVQLFRKERRRFAALSFLRRPPTPDAVERAPYSPPAPQVAARFRMSGGRTTRRASPSPVTDRLPILLYHRVAPTGAPATARYRVAPEAFDEQLRYLRAAGFYGVRLADWRQAMQRREALPGRAVLITFDDGYRDFQDHAWPTLERHGFSAAVFLVADRIGAKNEWDVALGEELPLLGWDEIHRLRDRGCEFGSHSATHTRLTDLTPAEVVSEAARARAALWRGLGEPVEAFAYPYGAEDPVVQHLVGACGYVYGLSCRPGRSGFDDPLLALPRVEITPEDDLAAFVGKLS
jgi:peptidoglycan/xylan/chitin deacetylase (PgdA/CDA1 family)/GT2 family glycosyltransferase